MIKANNEKYLKQQTIKSLLIEGMSDRLSFDERPDRQQDAVRWIA